MANRLQYEDSPYLRQHKDDLVDWWPFCKEALEKAKVQNKAIFISVGYDSSYWCGKMQEDVFLDAASAAILNESFISIKVDREEHPELDKYYQEVYALLNNSKGGWPNSVFCTPQNKPFFARTYMSALSVEGSNEGMGFKEIANIIATKIKEQDTKLLENAQEVDRFLKKITHPKEATHLSEEFYKTFVLQAKNNFDTKYAGFLQKPKFPHATTLSTLLKIATLYKSDEAKSMFIQTLNAMSRGGFYDLSKGGFYRYAQDDAWLVPHFEKTLYDNALLCSVYANAYLAFGDESHLNVAKATANFWHTFMSEDNLFYSKSYAKNESKEDLYIDKQVQTSWSSLMIHALFELGSIDSTYKERALKNLEALLSNLYKNTQLYHITLINKEAKVEAFLEDYAFISRALLSAYKSTHNELYLIHAQRFTNKALELFYEKGVWNFSVGEFATKADVSDNTYTSAVSVMVEALLLLSDYLNDEKYKHFAFKTLEYNSYELGRKPLLMPHMLTQMLHYLQFKSF